jgi:epoxyqueuosine reductase
LADLKDRIKEKARQLGFILAGVTSPDSPENFHRFEAWLRQGMHGTMNYLAGQRSRVRRADPRQSLPECKSILCLGIPYPPPESRQIASYALGADYHDVIPRKLQSIVQYIEEIAGRSVPNRSYTDTGPVLERELAQRAGLGWIGKNTCLINPKMGSTFLLAEILLGIELEADEPFRSDHCGTCTRCIQACPTQCIQPDRTLDARRCISYLTIEHRDEVPAEVRSLMQDWIFGCDVCQQVCPWNRFSPPADPALEPCIPLPVRSSDLLLDAPEFNRRFKRTPVKRAKHHGYLRNLCIAIGNGGNREDIPYLEKLSDRADPTIKEHAFWAIDRIRNRHDHG